MNKVSEKEICIYSIATIVTVVILICMQKRCFFKQLNAKTKFVRAGKKNCSSLQVDEFCEDIATVGDMLVIQGKNGLILYNATPVNEDTLISLYEYCIASHDVNQFIDWIIPACHDGSNYYHQRYQNIPEFSGSVAKIGKFYKIQGYSHTFLLAPCCGKLPQGFIDDVTCVISNKDGIIYGRMSCLAWAQKH